MASPSGEDTITSLLTCPVCYNLLQAPAFQCKNGHLVCSGCRQRITHCPSCREPMGDIRSLIVDQLTATLRFPCANKNYGCPELLLERFREEHQRNCPYRPVSCPCSDQGCSWEGDLSSLSSHFTRSHPQIPTFSRSSLLFMGVHSNQPNRLKWATILSCYNQQFFVCVTKHPYELPTFTITVHLLTISLPSTNFTYFVAFKKKSHSLQWTSTHIPSFGASTLSPAQPPLELSSDIVYSFGAHHNFKFFLSITPT
ncbi:E3 ubiquitin-protein ligase sina-like [Centruroides sculpturatus]|uniref:E3 ubiquitin-protein ligase sina-like n=1 Tax=Centruroides sculpturatus TaxID=218467 RepID=UPI000C6E67AF|nr:E3 ubiquitin-protein ligase sina-like [Centruroides sculpturatus]